MSGIRSRTYLVRQADVASTLRVNVVASNRSGSGRAVSDETAAVKTAVSVATGSSHSCALLTSGVVKCWGDNTLGEVAPSAGAEAPTPVDVPGITDAVQIAAADVTSCALLADGDVKCWGDVFGQNTSSAPVSMLPKGQIATELALGSWHGCALLSDGTVRCWGGNGSGELGDGTTETSWVPKQVVGIDDAVKIAAGAFHACAIVSGGAVKCWGLNRYGELGYVIDGGQSSTPMMVDGISGAVQLTAGLYNTCAIVSGGAVKCWGNYLGLYPPYVIVNDWAVPVQIPDIANAAQIGASGYRNCAALTDGTVSCWGFNGNGELGPSIGLGLSTANPVQVPTVANAIGIGAGGGVGIGGFGPEERPGWAPLQLEGFHTCAVLSNGAVKCWGANSKGELGDGTTNDSAAPVNVKGLP